MSPGPIVASTRWEIPSFAPIVAIVSVSGSSITPYFLLYQLQMASRSFGIPRDAEYRWFRGFFAASISFSTMCLGVGRSGLPIPRSMMSSPARRIFDLSSVTTANTYGGSRWILGNSSMEISFNGKGPNEPKYNRLARLGSREMDKTGQNGPPDATPAQPKSGRIAGTV